MRLLLSPLHIFIAALAIATALPARAEEKKPLLIFAAASLQPAFDALAKDYERESEITVTLSYAGSDTLAKQIEQGASADPFVSADTKWMDYLAEKRLITQATRTVIAGNRLVLVGPGPGAGRYRAPAWKSFCRV